LRVEAIDVLASELLANRHDDGKLDPGAALLLAPLVPADRLGRTLAALNRCAGTDMPGLRELVPNADHGLVDTHRHLTAEGHQSRLLLRLAKDVPDHRLRKTVGGHQGKTTLHRVVVRVVGVLNVTLKCHCLAITSCS